MSFKARSTKQIWQHKKAQNENGKLVTPLTPSIQLNAEKVYNVPRRLQFVPTELLGRHFYPTYELGATASLIPTKK